MLRLANNKDVDGLLKLQHQGGFSDWSNNHFQEAIAGQQCLVIEKRCQLIGFIIMSVLFEQAELLNMAVSREFQRQGLARLLYQEASRRVKTQGAKECLLEVAGSNLAAQRLYQSLGFIKIAERRNYYLLPNGLNDHAVIMRVTYD